MGTLMDGPVETLVERREKRAAAEAASQKLRLLFVVSSLEHGGAERHTVTLFNRLGERGHRCHLAFIKDRQDQLERLRLGPAATQSCLGARRFFDPPALTKLSRAITDSAPEVIVAANEYALMYATLARLRSRSRAAIVVTYHATRLIGASEQIKMIACRPLFWRAHCAIFVCNEQRRQWARRGVFSRRNEVIHNGVDIDEFTARLHPADRQGTRTALGIGDSDFVIGLAANLRPEKNPLQLVDAVAQLRQKSIPARALLIGDGEMRAAILARAQQRGIAEHVKITGFQSDVRPFVSACDAVALCSFTEAFSLAAIEAMALQRPVVHSEVGGAAEMIRPGWNGFLFPVGDLEALVQRLELLADREVSQRMGGNARATVERWFTERTMVERYERLLLELANARQSRAA